MTRPKLIHLVAALFVFATVWTPVERALAQQRTAQEMDDVVYLKDGSIIRGMIVEQRPGESVLIRTRDGNQFRYRMELIDRMTKEAPVRADVPVSADVPVRADIPVVRPNPKSAATAGILSFLLPGAGQAYNGQWGWALIYLGMTAWSFSMYATEAVSDACVYNYECGYATFYAGSTVFWYVASIIDAAVTANSINRKAQGSASLSVRPWVELARNRRAPVESSGFTALPRMSQSTLHVGLVRWSW